MVLTGHEQIAKRLDSVHQKLLETVSPLDPEIFSQRPSKDEWSVAEIVQHLYLVEERVIKDLKQRDSQRSATRRVLKEIHPNIYCFVAALEA